MKVQQFLWRQSSTLLDELLAGGFGVLGTRGYNAIQPRIRKVTAGSVVEYNVGDCMWEWGMGLPRRSLMSLPWSNVGRRPRNAKDVRMRTRGLVLPCYTQLPPKDRNVQWPGAPQLGVVRSAEAY